MLPTSSFALPSVMLSSSLSCVRISERAAVRSVKRFISPVLSSISVMAATARRMISDTA